MFKSFLIFLYIVSHSISSFAQQLDSTDYKVYSAIINSEVSDSTRKVAVIKESINTTEVKNNTSLILSGLKSNNHNDKNYLFSWTEDSVGVRPTEIDSITQSFILEFRSSVQRSLAISNSSLLKPHIDILKYNPIKHYKNWDNFYNKYPGSGGIFSFSSVNYFGKNLNTAIVYYWHRRNGLNGHGALVILSKIDSIWKIKYKNYIWWN